MKDIARDLGVSVITVSKVLRNHPDVGEDTRRRVLARVKELDDRPNLAARGIVTGRKLPDRPCRPDLLHPFFLTAESIAENLSKSGYYLVVSASDEDPLLEEQEVGQLRAHRLDSLIIAPCRSTADLIFRIEKQKTHTC